MRARRCRPSLFTPRLVVGAVRLRELRLEVGATLRFATETGDVGDTPGGSGLCPGAHSRC